MSYKSEAQKRKIRELFAKGKISKEALANFEKDSKGKKLPERITPKSDYRGDKS